MTRNQDSLRHGCKFLYNHEKLHKNSCLVLNTRENPKQEKVLDQNSNGTMSGNV